MNRKELNNILENHKKWLDGEEGGVYADLSYADMIGEMQAIDNNDECIEIIRNRWKMSDEI